MNTADRYNNRLGPLPRSTDLPRRTRPPYREGGRQRVNNFSRPHQHKRGTPAGEDGETSRQFLSLRLTNLLVSPSVDAAPAAAFASSIGSQVGQGTRLLSEVSWVRVPPDRQISAV